MDKEEKLSFQGPHGGNTANILNKPGSETKPDTALEHATLCPLQLPSYPLFSSGNICAKEPDWKPGRTFDLLYFFP